MSFEIGTDEDPRHFHEELGDNVGTRLNWLRAAVLGANDGIVSTAGVVMGVAGATDDSGAIVIAGIAALTAGALSMGTGEYVSVSTQRDSEKSILGLEAAELRQMPQTEERELAKMYVDKGLTPATAETWPSVSTRTPKSTSCRRAAASVRRSACRPVSASSIPASTAAARRSETSWESRSCSGAVTRTERARAR